MSTFTNAAHLSWRFISFSLLTIGVAAAQAAEVADMPVPKAGDKWTYHRTRDLPRSEDHLSRTVTEVSPTRGYIAIRGDGVPIKFDGAGNEIDQRGPEYCEERLKFPMSVGSKWTHDRTLGMVPGKVGPQEVLGHATWEVEAFEKVSVPAGTFDCFRVSGTEYLLNAVAVGHAFTTYWYCPSIRGVAKSQQVTKSWQGAPEITTVQELISFTEGQ